MVISVAVLVPSLVDTVVISLVDSKCFNAVRTCCRVSPVSSANSFCVVMICPGAGDPPLTHSAINNNVIHRTNVCGSEYHSQSIKRRCSLIKPFLFLAAISPLSMHFSVALFAKCYPVVDVQPQFGVFRIRFDVVGV